jgi:hypothetical protein
LPEETHQLTVRALVVGALLGCVGQCGCYQLSFIIANTRLVGASNIYLGLKTGFTFGPQLFGVRSLLVMTLGFLWRRGAPLVRANHIPRRSGKALHTPLPYSLQYSTYSHANANTPLGHLWILHHQSDEQSTPL